MYVVDGHGNDAERTLVSERDAASTYLDEFSPRYAGRVSGVTHGLAELPEFVSTILHEHEAIVGAIKTFVAEVDAELLAAMVRNMPGEVHRSQHQMNDFDPPTDDPDEAMAECLDQRFDVTREMTDYCEFANGFYEGYAAFLAVELATGVKAGIKGVQKAADVAERIREVTRNVDEIRPALRRGESSTGVQIARQAFPDGGERFGGLPTDLRTAGKVAAAVKRLQKVNRGVLDELTAQERTDLLRYVAKSPDGARLVNELGPERTKQLLTVSVKGADDVSLRENIFRLHERGISPDQVDEFVRNVNELRGTTGVSNVVEPVARGGGPSNFRGAATEADIAATIKRSDTREVDRLSREISVDGVGSSELDIVLKDGSTIEVKSGNLRLDPTADRTQELKYQRLANQLTVHEQYRAANDLGGNGYVIVRGETNNRVEQLIRDRGLQQTTLEDLL